MGPLTAGSRLVVAGLLSVTASCALSRDRPPYDEDGGLVDVPVAAPGRDAGPMRTDADRPDVGMSSTATYCVDIFSTEMLVPLVSPEVIDVPAGRTAALCFHNRERTGLTAMEIAPERGEGATVASGSTWNDPQPRCVGPRPSEEWIDVRSVGGMARVTLRCR